MTGISLRRLISTNKKLLPLVNGLVDTAAHPLAIVDDVGRLLWGRLTDDEAITHPVEVAGEVLGQVVGTGEQGAAVAALLAYLAEKEIEKQHLADEVLDRYREMSLLYVLSEKLSASLQFDEVVKITLEEASALITGAVAVLLLLDESGTRLNLLSAVGLPNPPSQVLPVPDGIIGTVLRSGNGEIINDVAADSRHLEGFPGLISLLCAPLKVKGQVIGAMVLGNETATIYHASDLKLFNALAFQAAPALENALLYEEKRQQAQELAEKNARLAKLNIAYGRFVPHEFLHFLGKESITEVQLGDQVQREMTILFSDVRSFSTLSERMSPKENFDFINDLLSRVGPIIRECDGFIDKYIGDAIMALFPYRADDALRSAIEIQQRLQRFNERRRRKQDALPVEIGVGLHTGTLMLGAIGEAQRMESTVISDAVNLAARLEGLTKVYGVQTIISESTLFSLNRPTEYHSRFLDRVKVKGKQEAVSVFEIFDGDTPEHVELKLATRTDFEKGLLFYHGQEFAEAKAHFAEVLAQNPADKAAELYLKRINHYMQLGIPPDWEGVESL